MAKKSRIDKPSYWPDVTTYADGLLEGDTAKLEETRKEACKILLNLGYSVERINQADCPFCLRAVWSYEMDDYDHTFIADVLRQSKGNKSFFIKTSTVDHHLSFQDEADYKVVIFNKGSKLRFVNLLIVPKICYILHDIYVVEEHITYSLSVIDRVLSAIKYNRVVGTIK